MRIPKVLYHYAKTLSAISILESKEIRLSDIAKSNDYLEGFMLYPDILGVILSSYKAAPFEFKYEGCQNLDAIELLLDDTRSMLDRRIKEHTSTNFVFCFSENGDLLSQWRAYADDGKGLCLGFDGRKMNEFCKQNPNVLLFTKVYYLTPNDYVEYLKEVAKRGLEELRGMRRWIVEEMTQDDSSKDTDSLIGFNFFGWLEYRIAESYAFKERHFSEEKEWRLFLYDVSYKQNAEFIFGERKRKSGPPVAADTDTLLRNRMGFYVKCDDLIPFIPVSFNELNEPLVSIITGPKSRIAVEDLNLFLCKHSLQAQLRQSQVSYS